MSTPADQVKVKTPPYASVKTFTNAINEIRDVLGHVPERIDRSSFPKLSGAAANEVIAALRFFGLVQGEKAIPTPLFEEYVMASDADRKPVLGRIVREAYSFVLSEASFNIERATSSQVQEVFRAGGVNGSTLTRAITLFLAMTKQAEIKVSPAVKPPTTPNSSKPKKAKREEVSEPVSDVQDATRQERVNNKADVHRFELPIPGKEPVIVLIPKSLDGDDWAMFQQMFAIYVKRWKGFQETGDGGQEEAAP